jgi:hypothetical protein
MTGFKLQTFGGKAPKVFARLLPEDMAQTATNCRLDSGRLEPWKDNLSSSKSFVASYAISGATKTIFKYNDSVWMGSDEEIDIVRSPIAEDPHERIYVTGIGGSSGYPRMTTGTIVGNSTYYRLGMPKPEDLTSVTLSPVNSANADDEVPQSVSYVFTYVSYYGEEGVNCDAEGAQIVDRHTDQTVTLDFPPNPSGNYRFLYKRVYRTDAGGSYRFVQNVPIAQDTFTDTVSDLNLREEIPTVKNDAPADDATADHKDGPLLGLVAMPNGILAGFSGQTVSFSEAFQPHAFPDEYKLTVKSDIVALSPLNTGLLVLTKGKPAIVQGLDPSSMSMMEIDSSLSCMSKRSVVDMGEFTIYSSPDGLVMATDSGLKLITEQTFTRDQWQAFGPSSIKGYLWEGQYIGFYSHGGVSKGFIFDPRGGKNGYTDLDFYATAGYNDLEDDSLYLVVGGALVKFAEGSTPQSFVWRGKKFYTPRPINPAVAKVDCDGYSPNPTFKLYADGELKHTQTVTDSNTFRLPSGYKAHEFEIELAGSVSINEVCVYESAEELGA